MTNARQRAADLHFCATCAADCQSSADHASRAFQNGDEAGGRLYVSNLDINLARLKAAMENVDRANRKIATNGPEAET